MWILTSADDIKNKNLLTKKTNIDIFVNSNVKVRNERKMRIITNTDDIKIKKLAYKQTKH